MRKRSMHFNMDKMSQHKASCISLFTRCDQFTTLEVFSGHSHCLHEVQCGSSAMMFAYFPPAMYQTCYNCLIYMYVACCTSQKPACSVFCCNFMCGAHPPTLGARSERRKLRDDGHAFQHQTGALSQMT